MNTRAALFSAPGEPLEVREIELEEPGPGDVLVRVAATGICGSDLHVVRGEWTRPTPMVLGHEGAGFVETVGSAVSGLAPSDRVVLSWAPACGACGPCLTGRRYACAPLRAGVAQGTLPDGTTRMWADGAPVYRMTAIGALAERIVVPASAALPLPQTISLQEAALIGCAALTGVGAALNRARVEPGSSVLVVGAGGVGQFCVQGARIAGAARIVAADPRPERRERALTLGASEALEPGEVAEGFDYAFDAVGGAGTFELALRATRAGGTTVAVGMAAAGVRYELDPAQLTNEEKTLTGSLYGSEDPAVALPLALEHVRSGRLDLEGALGPIYPLERVNEAIKASMTEAAGRVLVTMADS
jgi:S-(hydroxymethyl)glutathione dehydrogenase/alcohol dehydrogenase